MASNGVVDDAAFESSRIQFRSIFLAGITLVSQQLDAF